MADFDPIVERAEGTSYDPIIPNITEWPIAKLYQDKPALIEEIRAFAVEQIKAKYTTAAQLDRLVSGAHFNEFKRMQQQPWKVDKKDEGDFWRGIKKEGNAIDINGENVYDEYVVIIDKIAERYITEISGNFFPRSYHFAKRFLSFGFASLLNAFQARNIRAVFDHRIFIQDKIKLLGHLDHIRELGKKGTIVLLPTHFSNLDSIMLGWGIHALGLPAMIYGAGLNLFNSRPIAYFMNRLGAYKVDRRKKNLIYLICLKAFSTKSLMKGAHSLFFPGGTRSRSGGLEDNLKLGLLGTCFDAQRLNLEQNNGEKIFIVPLVMSYHVVLEAKSLINQHLKKSQAEKYYFHKDEFRSRKKVIKFFLGLLKSKSEIYLSFGEPMDLFGNKLDQEGQSLDKNGNQIDIADYFSDESGLVVDNQRDNVYTKNLGELVLKRFKKENVVLSSHLLAFVAYEVLKKKHNAEDFYDLIDVDRKKLTLTYDELKEAVAGVLKEILRRSSQEQIKCTNLLAEGAIEEIIEHGIKNVGVFHERAALTINKQNVISTESLELLYYYRNRLVGYGLDQYI